MSNSETGKIIEALMKDVLQREIRPTLERIMTAETDNRRIFRMMSEMVTGMEVLWNIPPAVTIFGSSRARPQDRIYRVTRHISDRLAQEGFAVISGGGAGGDGGR